MIPQSYQAVSDSKIPFVTRSQSNETETPITTALDNSGLFKRTTSAVEALGLHESSEWDDTDVMMTTTINSRASGVMRAVGQQRDLTHPNSIQRAKQEPSASTYTKVLCRFNAGENEVPFPLFSPQRVSASSSKHLPVLGDRLGI